MSVSLWRWTEACEGTPCPGDCDLCEKEEPMKLTALQAEYLNAINGFVTAEYGDSIPQEEVDPEFVGVLHSTFGEEEHEVQVYVDFAEDDDVIEKVWVNGTEMYREHYTHDEFLRDVKTWSFDALYDWALDVIRDNWKEK